MALALYRKYRPRTFSEVIGQDHVTEPLTQALRSGRLHHAYLFSGPRGCGKTSSARILARSLNCVKGPTPDPCGECESCRALAPDGPGSIDVIEIDAASHGGVDDARDLRERAFFAPVSNRYKVYVIDEAHMVSTQGFNALLKLVEEPPEYVTFVFATTEPEKVLGTIRSRTHHYPFRLIPPNVLRPYLEMLCREEGVAVEPAVFPLVVRAGGGSVRDSLSVLDQLIAGAGPAGVTYARALGLLGVTDVALIDEMCDALAAEDGASAYATIDRLVEAGHDPRRFAGDLLERLRDLIILQRVPDAAAKGLIDAPADQLDRMAAQAQRFGPAAVSRCADLVHAGLTEMRGATAPRLLMELVVARMLLPGADDAGPALLHRLERMERRLTAANEPATGTPAEAGAPPAVPAPAAAVPAGAPVPDASAAPVPAPPVAAPAGRPAPQTPPAGRESGPAAGPGALDAAGVRRVWDEILTMVGRRSKRAAAVVREATVRDVDGDVLVLVFKHSVHADMLANSPDLLIEAVHEVLGGTWRVRCEHAGGSGPAPVVGATADRSGPVGAEGDPPRGARGGGARPGGIRRGQPPGGDGAGTAGPGRSAAATSGSAVAPSGSGGGTPGSGGATSGSGGALSGPGGTAAGSGAGTTSATSGRGGPAKRPDGPDGRAGTPSAAASQPGPVDDAEWPATALPGGMAAAAGPPTPEHGAPARPAGGYAAAGAGTQTRGVAGAAAPARAAAGTGTRARPAAARTGAARAAGAAGGGSTAVRGGGGRTARRGPGTGGATSPSARRSGATDPGWADVPPPDEPPYDPDYDTAPPPAYEGFDPGDEPTDEVVDEATARRSSEQQALDLLRQTLGAEKIGEVGG